MMTTTTPDATVQPLGQHIASHSVVTITDAIDSITAVVNWIASIRVFCVEKVRIVGRMLIFFTQAIDAWRLLPSCRALPCQYSFPIAVRVGD